MLTICIPTWNRVENLEICLESIVSQVYAVMSDVKIFVFNNASDDGTQELLDKYQSFYPDIISFATAPEHLDYSGSFKEAFTTATTEWSWMMGDDDFIMPGGIAFVCDVIKSERYEFFHLPERTRSRGTQDIYSGTMLEMANTLGLVEFTGFISGNVCKSKYLRAGFASKNLHIYNESAFVQSLILLEALHDKHCAYIDIPTIDLQREQNQEKTAQRWTAANTCLRYNRLGEGLIALVEDGLLPIGLPAEFFRYLGGDLFGKILYTFWNDLNGGGGLAADIEWLRLLHMAGLLPTTEGRERIAAIEAYRGSLQEYRLMLERQNELSSQANKMFKRCIPNCYPETYI